LNEWISTTGTGNNIGRVAVNTGTQQSNYAWNGMTLTRNGSTVTATSNANGIDGENITAAQAKTQTWWTSTAGISTWDFGTVWQWDDNGVNMPSLRGVGTPLPWPGYLQ